MNRIEFWMLVAMVGTAAAGTIWYVYIDLMNRGSLSAVGWALIAGIWFVVFRRLFHYWRRR